MGSQMTRPRGPLFERPKNCLGLFLVPQFPLFLEEEEEEEEEDIADRETLQLLYLTTS